MDNPIIKTFVEEVHKITEAQPQSVYFFGSGLNKVEARDIDLIWVSQSTSFDGRLKAIEISQKLSGASCVCDATFVSFQELKIAPFHALHPYIGFPLVIRTYAQLIDGPDIGAFIPDLSEKTIYELRFWDAFRYWRYFYRGGKMKAVTSMLQGIAVAVHEVPGTEAFERTRIHAALMSGDGIWAKVYRDSLTKGSLSDHRLVLDTLLDLATEATWGNGLVIPANWLLWSVNGELAALLSESERERSVLGESIQLTDFSRRLKSIVFQPTL